jgi:DNA processing protein
MEDRKPDEDDLRYWLALLRTPGLGSRGCNTLLEQVNHPAELFHTVPPRSAASGIDQEILQHLRNPRWEEVEGDLRWLEAPDHYLITRQDPRFPVLLREIPDPPPALFLQGDPALLGSPQLAIVGSRNPSPGGRETAREFARFLTTAGVTITSGLAIGIDGAAHEGALAGGGETIAVTGTGLDLVYPARQRPLAHQIAEQGALVSEFPPGTPALPANFPRRNRIISGLSLGTLVVEAALNSGSLITARLAAEQGREVFAIPGSIHNPMARGCHALIRQGAKLVETAGDILEELAPLLGSLSTHAAADTKAAGTGSATPQKLDQEYIRLLEQIGFDPVSVDQLIARSGLTATVVSSMLLLLELEGHVSSAPGGRYCRTEYSTSFPPRSDWNPDRGGSSTEDPA